MSLNSTAFLPFLLAVFAAAALGGPRWRWAVLLGATAAFCASLGPPSLLILLGSVIVESWGFALAIDRVQEPARTRLLRLGVAVNLGALILVRSSGAVAAIGASFYVLQVVSYLVDVRDGVAPAERHLGRYALFLTFFPKFVQGPIERAGGLLAQLNEPRPLSAAEVAAGAKLVAWGLFQKVVVADRLAPLANVVFDDVGRWHGLPLAIGTYAYAAQIYFDFAGYTDLALGVGLLFGVRLTQNFDAPYLAASVAEFWRRWHVSFSSWLLEYVFRPLQLALRGARTWGTPAALLMTFLVSGLWHGGRAGFVVWGLLHGLYLAVSLLLRRPWARLLASLRVRGTAVARVVQIGLTFHLVCFAWIFFRASSIADALRIVSNLGGGLVASVGAVARGERWDTLLFLGQGRAGFVFAIGLVTGAALLRPLFRSATLVEPPSLSRLWSLARPAVYAAVLYLLLFAGTATRSFVYEQF